VKAGVGGTDILQFFDPMVRFVDEAVAKGGGVLIHCVAGAHRAGTTTCAFLMHRNNALSVGGAIAHCKARRPVVDPAISSQLMHVLHRLHAAYNGSSEMPIVEGSCHLGPARRCTASHTVQALSSGTGCSVSASCDSSASTIAMPRKPGAGSVVGQILDLDMEGRKVLASSF
jgi:hypothetical protein